MQMCKNVNHDVSMHPPIQQQSISRDSGSQKVWMMRRKLLIMQYRNQQLIKPNGRVRFSRNGNRIDQWSPVLWNPAAFLPRKTLKKEYKLWKQPIQPCLHAVSTTGCRCSFKVSDSSGERYHSRSLESIICGLKGHLSDVNGSAALNPVDMSYRR